MHVAMNDVIFAGIGYLFGSIPFGLLLTRLAGTQDLRSIGSGNIGATNVLRTGRKDLAAATLLLDGGKGALAVLIAYAMGSYLAPLLAGLFAVIGHMFPIWLKFKGGKGVATIMGVLLALNPFTGLSVAAIWLVSALITRISSLSALIASFCAPGLIFLFTGSQQAAFTLSLITVLIWVKHRENIKRLVKGEEPKIGNKK